MDTTELPLRAVVRDRIRRLIIDGSLAPGSRLVERSLDAELAVSRVPVREALRDLVAEGYAVDRPTSPDNQRRGIAVRDYPAEEIDELFDVRAALESVLLHRSFTVLSDEGRGRLRRCLDTAAAALERDDLVAAVDANAAFHQVWADAVAGPLTRGLLSGIRDRMQWLLRQHDDPAAIHLEHEALFTAIVDGDEPAADRIFRQHLSTSRAAVAR
ncbi:MAG: GntR family transcriptional regulator [Nakamurella sp.]